MSLFIISNKPTSINDLRYWFDASDISSLSLTAVCSATASVISISDKVNGLSLPSVGTSYPIYYYKNINNQNSIYFQYINNQNVSPNDRLASTSITFSSTGSLYTVAKWGATSSSYISWAVSIAPSSRNDSTWSDFNLYYTNPIDKGIFSSVGTAFTTTIGLFNGVPNGTSSDINSISVDIFSTRNNLNNLSKFHNTNLYGSMEGYTNATYSLTTTSNELTIGDYHTGSSEITGFKGYFCELLYYNRYLTDVEHEKVIQYLKNKWILLPVLN